MKDANTQVAIKGIQDGLLITVPEEEETEPLSAVLATIDDRPDFFRGARLAFQFGSRSLGAAQLGRLRVALAAREVTLWAVLSSSAETRPAPTPTASSMPAAADLGFALDIRPSTRQEEVEDIPFDSELKGDEATFIKRTLRSGHSIRHPGHVIVFGDANPGSEIIAGGNIIVWGKLRGVAHAGAAGDESAIVCALDLAPTQLRIAGHIAISPERRGRPKPEMALIRDGDLVAEVWEYEGRR